MFRIGRVGVQYWHLLVPILIAAAILRFIGLNWDHGFYLHPDERFIVMVTVDTKWPASIAQYFDSATSPLNPYNTSHGSFIYGTFPLFLTKAIGTLTGNDVYGNAHLAGRFLSALADTGTVFLTGWIARRFFGRWAGLLAATFIAFTMLHIQSAHFYTVDAMSVFFAMASFVTIVKGWDRKSIAWYMVAGIMLGLTGACKPNYLIALGFLALPVLETIRLHGWSALIPRARGRIFPTIPAVVVSALVAFWVFRVAQPYAFAGPHIWDIGLNPQWTKDLAYWRQAQNGLIDVKSSVQWVGRTPMLYITENMVKWGMGWPLGIAALAGLALGAVRALQSPRWPSWWWLGMLGWTGSQYLLYGMNQAQAQRYLLSVYPLFIVFAAGLLVELARRIPRPSAWPTWAAPGRLLIALAVVYTVFYGIAFDSLYVRPLSRVQASEWYYAHVPPGSVSTAEYWDDALPIALPGQPRDLYKVITLDLYGNEGPGSFKLSKLMGQLEQADYIVISSNRVIKSVPQQPERYPLANRYYDMLENGELGFDKVATFSQVPKLFGIRFDDTNAEETLTVYEHPYVQVFKKSDRFDRAYVYNELERALGYGGVSYLPGDPVPEQLWMTPAQITRMHERGTWRDAFSLSGFGADHPLLATWLALQLFAIAGLPLALLVFRRFPDRGWVMAKLLGLLLTTWIVWWFGSLGVIPFGRIAIGFGAVALFLVGLALSRRTFARDLLRSRDQLPRLLALETIFALILALFGWLRSLDAAFLHLGTADQTPWFLAQFQGIVRSATFPPTDIWASGGVQHGPYWGLLPFALIARLTGIPPTISFVLIPAIIAALLAVSLWSVARAAMANIRGQRRDASALVAPVVILFGGGFSLARSIAAGEHGHTPITGVLARLGPIGELIHGLSQLRTSSADPVALRERSTLVGHGWEFWSPFDGLVSGVPSPTVTVLPAAVLAIAAGLSLVRMTSSPHRRFSLVAPGIVLGLAIGAMQSSAVWGMVPALAIGVITVIVATLAGDDVRPNWPTLRAGLLGIVGVLAIAMVGFLPYSRQFVVSPRNALQSPIVPLDAIAPYIAPLVVVLAIIVLGRSIAAAISRDGDFPLATAMMGVFATISLALVWRVDQTLLLGGALAVLGAALCWLDSRDPDALFVDTLALVAAVLWVMMTDAPGSQDSFQFAANHEISALLLLLLGIVVSVSLPRLPSSIGSRWPIPAQAISIITSILVVGGLVCTMGQPIVTTMILERGSTGRTLDSTSWMASNDTFRADHDAARWLMEHTDGMPVLLEGNSSDYHHATRISTATGLPTVIGWVGPERLARPGWGDAVIQRQTAVNTIYSQPGPLSGVRPLLDQYDVTLIYVGETERSLYPTTGLMKFDDAATSGELEKIYERDGVTIYRYAHT